VEIARITAQYLQDASRAMELAMQLATAQPQVEEGPQGPTQMGSVGPTLVLVPPTNAVPLRDFVVLQKV
jgi:hypothetical protein